MLCCVAVWSKIDPKKFEKLAVHIDSIAKIHRYMCLGMSRVVDTGGVQNYDGGDEHVADVFLKNAPFLRMYSQV